MIPPLRHKITLPSGVWTWEERRGGGTIIRNPPQTKTIYVSPLRLLELPSSAQFLCDSLPLLTRIHVRQYIINHLEGEFST